MGLLEDKVVPGREERIKASMAFGGSACGLGKADKICLRNQERGFAQAGLCQLLPTLGMLASLPDTAIIVHGAIGCASTGFGANIGSRLRHVQMGRTDIKDTVWVSTNLTESEVVHGGEARLEETIYEVNENLKPKSIVVLQTCAPSIIGDDLQSVIDRVRDKLDTPVLASTCEGFKTKIWATGYDVAFHSIVHGFIEKDREGRPPRKEGRKEGERPIVNIINLASVGLTDEKEIIRMLESIGIEVIVGPNFASRESIRRMTQADLTVSICPTHDDYFIDYLYKEYGIPYVLRDMPIGLENTKNWLLDIAGKVGLIKEAEKFIEEETAKTKKAVAKFLPYFEGKKVFLSAGEFRALVTGMLIQELGMEVVGLRAYHHDHFGDEFYSKLVEAQKGKDFIVDIANFQPFELTNILQKIKPDLFIGHVSDNLSAAKLGFPAATIFRIFDYYIGYRGFYEVAKKFTRVLKNPAFNKKLSENVSHPYKIEWYEENPFKFIKAGTNQNTEGEVTEIENSYDFSSLKGVI
ncbi:MAG: nitrogenase component 1 [Clostridia bacterium]|nr:nitrogenase component 1 [Clostridia bacterium]